MSAPTPARPAPRTARLRADRPPADGPRPRGGLRCPAPRRRPAEERRPRRPRRNRPVRSRRTPVRTTGWHRPLRPEPRPARAGSSTRGCTASQKLRRPRRIREAITRSRDRRHEISARRGVSRSGRFELPPQPQTAAGSSISRASATFLVAASSVGSRSRALRSSQSLGRSLRTRQPASRVGRSSAAGLLVGQA